MNKKIKLCKWLAQRWKCGGRRERTMPEGNNRPKRKSGKRTERGGRARRWPNEGRIEIASKLNEKAIRGDKRPCKQMEGNS